MLREEPMRSIRVRQPHHLSVAEARGRIERAAQGAADQYRLIWRWVDGVLEVFPPPGMAKGAHGRLLLSEGAVHAEVELPGRYGLIQGRVESRLAAKLQELLGH